MAKKEYGSLIDVIDDDEDLKENQEKYLLFMSYANLFEDETFQENLYLTSIELNNKYMTVNPNSWRRFLNHNGIRTYIKGFKDELAERRADITLKNPTKTREALMVKDKIEESKDVEDNSNWVVFFLPQKTYELD